MKQSNFEIVENLPVASSVYRLSLTGDTSEVKVPGQFVNLKINGVYLRRPLSVCDCEHNRLTLLYKTVGKGTEILSHMNSGEHLNLLTGLGNGFSVEKSGMRPLLVGGGIGCPPMFWLCRALLTVGKEPSVLLGFRTAADAVLIDAFTSLGISVTVTTEDGSLGQRGYVTTVLDSLSFDSLYACGPEPMLHALYDASNMPGQFSFEERMGCGFGACMGCSCRTKYGTKRICKDGPVLEREEIIW